MTTRSWKAIPAVALAALITTACVETIYEVIPVGTVAVEGVTATLTPGQSVQLNARALGSAGESLSGRTASWSSSNTAVATVSATGLLTTVAPGTTQVTATVESVSQGSAVTVNYPLPTVSTISPAAALTGQATTVTVNGTRFYPTSQVRLNGNAKTTIYVSSTQLRASLTAADVAAAGTQALTIFNPAPGGGLSNSVSFGVATRCSVSQAAITNISIGQTVNGTLAAGDCVESDMSFADVYRLTLTTTATFSISMNSSAVDAYLILRSSAGSIIEEDDDGGGGTNSRIVQTLGPGTYYIFANSLDAGETGSYSLSVTSGTSGVCTLVGTVTRPQTLNGSLSTSDCRLTNGQYADGYQITFTTTTTVTVTLTSTAFDAYLYILDNGSNTIVEDDDSGGGTNARIVRTLPAGTYSIWVSSFDPAETGSYTLVVS